MAAPGSNPFVNSDNVPAGQPISIVIQNADAREFPFEIIDVSREQGGDRVLISWMSSVGGIYHLESSPDLKSWSSVGTGDIIAKGEVTTSEITIPPSANERQYYRVVRTW